MPNPRRTQEEGLTKSLSSWLSFLTELNPKPIAGPVLCLDPGETTGYAVFADGEMIDCGETVIRENLLAFEALIDRIKPTFLVCEEYRVYAHKRNQHTWSTIPTLRYVGALQLLCMQRNLPIQFQSAAAAKGYASDDKLRQWRLLQTRERHANDAIRHGCYFHLFDRGARQRG